MVKGDAVGLRVGLPEGVREGEAVPEGEREGEGEEEGVGDRERALDTEAKEEAVAVTEGVVVGVEKAVAMAEGMGVGVEEGEWVLGGLGELLEDSVFEWPGVPVVVGLVECAALLVGRRGVGVGDRVARGDGEGERVAPRVGREGEAEGEGDAVPTRSAGEGAVHPCPPRNCCVPGGQDTTGGKVWVAVEGGVRVVVEEEEGVKGEVGERGGEWEGRLLLDPEVVLEGRGEEVEDVEGVTVGVLEKLGMGAGVIPVPK